MYGYCSRHNRYSCALCRSSDNLGDVSIGSDGDIAFGIGGGLTIEPDGDLGIQVAPGFSIEFGGDDGGLF